MQKWERILSEMYCYHDGPVPSGLRERLERVNHLCVLAGGELVSRQAIAIVVAQWEAEQ